MSNSDVKKRTKHPLPYALHLQKSIKQKEGAKAKIRGLGDNNVRRGRAHFRVFSEPYGE